MNKTYRFLGNRGRTTIPFSLRMELGIKRNDLVSFERLGDTIVIRKEKICDGCAESSPREQAISVTAGKSQKKKNTRTSAERKTLKLMI